MNTLNLSGEQGAVMLVHTGRKVVADSEIFVFGSDERGIHGAGAAAYAAMHYGAQKFVGRGMTGQSYALPTKDRSVETLSLGEIEKNVREFIRFARQNPDKKFRLTAIGCGLAGYTADQIAPMVADAPDNVRLPPEFRDTLSYLPEKRFWPQEDFVR